MVETKNLLIGKSCYDCEYYINEICYQSMIPIPESKGYNKWMKHKTIAEWQESILKSICILEEYLYGKKSSKKMA